MDKIVPYQTVETGSTPKGNILCRSGHHKWIVDKAARFDVKSGKRVTFLRCARCGKTHVRGCLMQAEPHEFKG